MPDTYCYACNSPADHVENHNDLLTQGLVSYKQGNVVLTEDGKFAKAFGLF